ncbi:uncharacterized protein METZ01_LOCUS430946 [marine metagenome]|uniref:Uncharacterized protein n=1 Tax=marine metagenome TaxID=408172 RepID=A0A382Y415_9ZZZZ
MNSDPLYDKWDIIGDLITRFGEKSVLESIGHFMSEKEVNNLYKFICSNYNDSINQNR